LTLLPPEAAGFLLQRERLADKNFSDEQRTIGFGSLRKDFNHHAVGFELSQPCPRRCGDEE
jgi:hypothetical protein